jgi:hypothetical protein
MAPDRTRAEQKEQQEIGDVLRFYLILNEL